MCRLARSRASNAAVAGIGEAEPTAIWRTSPISRQITSASSSSSRKVFGHKKLQLAVMPGFMPGIHVLCFKQKVVDGRDKPGHDD